MDRCEVIDQMFNLMIDNNANHCTNGVKQMATRCFTFGRRGCSAAVTVDNLHFVLSGN
jgi:hypothetical protein